MLLETLAHAWQISSVPHPWLLGCLHQLHTHPPGNSAVCWDSIPVDSALFHCLHISILLCQWLRWFLLLSCHLHVWPEHQDKDYQVGPDRCGSAGWVSTCRLKGWQFKSRSDTCLGCGSGPRLGCIREATDLCFYPTSTSLSLSSSLALAVKIK